MLWIKRAIVALASLSVACNGMRIAPRLGTVGMPLCTVASKPQPNQPEPKSLNTVFLVLPEKPDLTDNAALTKVDIGDHQCAVIKVDHNVGAGASDNKEANVIQLLSNAYKIGLNELANETVYEKRKNHTNIVELAITTLRADGVLIPVEYHSLISMGRAVYQLQLLDLVLLLLRQIDDVKLNLHFVVYNYDERRGDDAARNDFNERREKEIQAALAQMFQSANDLVDISVTFTPHTKVGQYLEATSGWIGNRISLKQACPIEFESESNKKEESVTKLRKIQGHMDSSVNDVAGKLKEVDLSKDTRPLRQLLEIANEVELSVNKWLGESAVSLAEMPDKLKVQADTLVKALVAEFDSRARQVAGRTEALYKLVRRNMVESLQNKLMVMMDGMALKIQDTVLQEFQEELQSISVDENLDLSLQEAIGKYDRRYCALVEQRRFDILRGNKLYDLKAQAQRRDVIESMKDVANHVLEFAIAKGLFYAKFSILDGISYIPSNPVTRFIAKWIKLLKIPLRISLHYLSPTAFGFSNLFRDRIPLKPGMLRYFTDGRERSTFSKDPSTRALANSLVYSRE
ncbi:hypothetical protein, conserved [Babesia bigemina]|uniref:Uncharacterized protein n=1 Tax=Babesia bigemina TaxID=5866 RepID=A0A061D882_BABBI|nr:hypothetical protein, conserved [Babesia bigemina]CDR96738.1 hypothetical protein, conserved [Babesia bigemina]|eukprot:XP_012768924.1 hypothetical protein, conserved [Babesia bigemina]